MSVRCITAVFDKSEASGNARFIMVCLADSADDYGFCFPSINTLAKKTRLSRSTVQRALTDLEATEELHVHRRQATGQSSVYIIRLGFPAVPMDHRFYDLARMLGIAHEGGVGQNDTPPQSDTRGGGQSDTRGVSLLTPEEPSVETKAIPPVCPPQLDLGATTLPSGPTKKDRKRPARPMPDPWELGDGKTYDIAKRRYVDVFTAEREFDAFKAHHQAKGSMFVDWEAAWNTWLINRERFQQERAK